ncbi:MAG: YgjV family protein [Ruminococcaceae bacterium]|nr:YgjV family protein [Oscillospiraceae bacterium]
MRMWGQIISLIAMMAIILSFQCKSNKRLIEVIGTGALLFAVSYFLLGQPAAAMFNIISAICSIVCLKDNLKNKFVFGIIAALYAVATWFTYDGWWSLMLMAAQLAASYSLMFKSGTFIRNMRFFFVSPVWLINNTVMCFTVGGIICEIITMISVIVSFIRYRKTGFEE